MNLKWTVLVVLVLAVVVNHQVLAEIESRPEIWTPRSKDYWSQIMKLSTWDEIFKKYYLNDQKSDERETDRVAQLQNKWKSMVLDCIKEQNKKKLEKTTESSKKYVIYDMLSLLTPVLAGKITDIDDKTFVKMAKEEENQPNKIDEDHKAWKFGNKKTNRVESIFEGLNDKMYNGNEEKSAQPKPEDKIDHAKHFLMSLLEDFDAIPKTYKVDAKFEILSVLRKYNKYYETSSTSIPPVVIPEYKRPESSDTDSSVLTDLFSD